MKYALANANIKANMIVFSGSHDDWVMRITADRRIEANADVKVTEAAKKVLEAMQRMLPLQREWVGLTNEEIKVFDTWHDNREEEDGWVSPSEIVAYIEAKLRSKNT